MVRAQRDLIGVLLTDVGGHAVDVLHDFHGVFEHVGVDLLEEIRLHRTAWSHVDDFVNEVDISHRDGITGTQFSGKLELLFALVRVLYMEGAFVVKVL